MFVTYTPEDGSAAPQTWEFDARKVKASRAEMIEKRAGESWQTWLTHIEQGHMRARRVLLWHLMSLPHPTMRFEDTPDFLAGEVEVSYSAAELADYRDRIMQAGLPEDQANQVLAAVDIELGEARKREAERRQAEELPDAEEPGKAPSPSGGNATRGRSPKSSA